MREEGKFFRWLLNVGLHSSGLGGITCVFISATSRFPKKELNIVILLFPQKNIENAFFSGKGLFRVRQNRGAGLHTFFGKGKKDFFFLFNRQGRRRLSFPPEGRLFGLSGAASLHTFGGGRKRRGRDGTVFPVFFPPRAMYVYMRSPFWGVWEGNIGIEWVEGRKSFFGAGCFPFPPGVKRRGKGKRKKKDPLLCSFWGEFK